MEKTDFDIAVTAVGTRVDGPILEDGKVSGIRAEGFELRAGATVIATRPSSSGTASSSARV